MDLIAELKSRCERVPGLVLEVNGDSIAVRPKSDKGFTVWLYIEGKQIVVGYEAWHERFSSEQKAARCFIDGLKGVRRLKTFYRGEKPYKWVVEHLNGDRWIEYSRTELIFSPFWRKRRIRILQNTIPFPGMAGY